MKSSQRKAIFAQMVRRTGRRASAHVSNAGRGLMTLPKSNRELSESEYRAKERVKRGAVAGTAAGIGVGLYKSKFSRNVIRDTAKEVLLYGAEKGVRLNTLGLKYVGKRLLPFAAVGLAAGGIGRALLNQEHVQKIRPNKRVGQESKFRMRRVGK